MLSASVSQYLNISQRGAPHALLFRGSRQGDARQIIEFFEPTPHAELRIEAPPRPRHATRHWEHCILCEHAFSLARMPMRWFGICGPCYKDTSTRVRMFCKNATQRWRKASITDFGKEDIDAVKVFDKDPSPIQVVLLRLCEQVGVSTREPADAPRWGLAKRLGVNPDTLPQMVRGKVPLPLEAEVTLIMNAMAWFAEQKAIKADLDREYGDDDSHVDPDDPEILAFAASLRRQLGSVR